MILIIDFHLKVSRGPKNKQKQDKILGTKGLH